MCKGNRGWCFVARVKITRFLVLKTAAHSSVLFSPPQSSKALISPELTLRIAECFSAVPTYDQFIANFSPSANFVMHLNYFRRVRAHTDIPFLYRVNDSTETLEDVAQR